MSLNSTNMYDRQITVFSPEEYAFRACEASNITAIAIRGDDSAVIVSQRKTSNTALFQDKLLDPSSLSCLHYVTRNIGGAFIGMPADCRATLNSAQVKAFQFHHANGYNIPIQYLVEKLANMNQVYTQHAYMRLQACIGIVIGIDEDTEKPQVFKFDPAGWYSGYKAVAYSSKEADAIGKLERIVSKNKVDTLENTIMCAIEAIQEVLNMQVKADDIEIAVVNVQNRIFRRINNAEVDSYLNMIHERDIEV